jgi:prefoldin subunit 5
MAKKSSQKAPKNFDRELHLKFVSLEKELKKSFGEIRNLLMETKKEILNELRTMREELAAFNKRITSLEQPLQATSG